jgi:hypothetical protein
MDLPAFAAMRVVRRFPDSAWVRRIGCALAEKMKVLSLFFFDYAKLVI